MNLCRYCGLPGATVETVAYWNGTKFFCHAECKKSGEKEESIECQIIDADCNDCAHFQRGAEILKSIPKSFAGHCKKFNKTTTAHPHFYTGRECFEHRAEYFKPGSAGHRHLAQAQLSEPGSRRAG